MRILQPHFKVTHYTLISNHKRLHYTSIFNSTAKYECVLWEQTNAMFKGCYTRCCVTRHSYFAYGTLECYLKSHTGAALNRLCLVQCKKVKLA